MSSSIVVLTPVRNEAWILERFLAVTSQFADVIIVADQQSTDGSREICRRFPKVVLFDNSDTAYDEASRQRLLIDRAREIVPGRRVLLALDADEILAADSLQVSGWQTMRNAEPGTVFYFEKPDLVGSTAQCIRYLDCFWPLAFADDGSEHKPKHIHSIRIPVPEGAPVCHLEDIRFVHYGLIRINAVKSRMRYYTVQENLAGTNPGYRRRLTYSARNWRIKFAALEPSSDRWFTEWERQGIVVRAIEDAPFHWWDFEVLRILGRRGSWRFWMDDIWNFEWEACLKEGHARGLIGLPSTPPPPPPVFAQRVAAVIEAVILRLRSVYRTSGVPRGEKIPEL